jgi:hypothetical protein
MPTKHGDLGLFNDPVAQRMLQFSGPAQGALGDGSDGHDTSRLE